MKEEEEREVVCKEVAKTEVFENFDLDLHLTNHQPRPPYTPLAFSQPSDTLFSTAPPFTFLSELKSTLKSAAPDDFIYKEFDP